MHLAQQSTKFRFSDPVQMHRSLPVGTYDLIPTMQGYVLNARAGFQMPPKIYGDNSEFTKRCLSTFHKLGKGMGVLLSGPKGCGKSLTAKQIASQSGLPVVCLSEPAGGSGFVEFLSSMETPCVFFIDEFEKLYRDQEMRNSMLSVLDGTADNKHLFVLTSNDANIGEYFTNRPGRIRYHKKYEHLPMEVLSEMVDDKVKDKKLNKEIKSFLNEFGSINPDTLVELIRECLLHNEGPRNFIDVFNIQTEFSGYWDVEMIKTTWEPKPGLNKKQKEQADRFISEWDDDENYALATYGQYKDLCVQKLSLVTSNFCDCFSDVGRMRDGFQAHIRNLRDEKGKPVGGFNIYPAEVKTIKREGGKVIVTMRDGTVVKFTRCGSYRKYEE